MDNSCCLSIFWSRLDIDWKKKPNKNPKRMYSPQQTEIVLFIEQSSLHGPQTDFHFSVLNMSFLY